MQKIVYKTRHVKTIDFPFEKYCKRKANFNIEYSFEMSKRTMSILNLVPLTLMNNAAQIIKIIFFSIKIYLTLICIDLMIIRF